MNISTQKKWHNGGLHFFFRRPLILESPQHFHGGSQASHENDPAEELKSVSPDLCNQSRKPLNPAPATHLHHKTRQSIKAFNITLLVTQGKQLFYLLFFKNLEKEQRTK